MLPSQALLLLRHLDNDLVIILYIYIYCSSTYTYDFINLTLGHFFPRYPSVALARNIYRLKVPTLAKGPFHRKARGNSWAVYLYIIIK